MTDRHLRMLSELLQTVSEYLQDMEQMEDLEDELLQKTAALLQIVNGFNELLKLEIHGQTNEPGKRKG